jgi:LMBR1 domain-containing protein 1
MQINPVPIVGSVLGQCSHQRQSPPIISRTFHTFFGSLSFFFFDSISICRHAGALFAIYINLQVLLAFQDPEDKKISILPKAVFVLAMTLAECTVMLLPFDVAISTSEDLRNSMMILWQILCLLLIILLVFVIPFALYFYESDNHGMKGVMSQIFTAFQYHACTLIAVGLVLTWLFLLFGTALIPCQSFTTPLESFESIGNYPLIDIQPVHLSDKSDTIALEVQVTFGVFVIGVFCFVGWFFFVLFSSIGFVSLPFDCFAEFVCRPRKLSPNQFTTRKAELNRRAKELKNLALIIEREGHHKAKTQRNKLIFNRFKKATHFLERDWNLLQQSVNEGTSALVSFAMFILAIVTTAFSLCWLVHIILFMFLSPEHSQPFLNTLFVTLDSSFAFLGTFLYGCFAFYLLWTLLKGNMTISTLFDFLVIHPLKPKQTDMNALLFNVGLTLLCAIPVVQFCSMAFSLYTHNSAIQHILGIQVSNLKVMRMFFLNNVFMYAFFSLCGVTFLYLLIWDVRTRKRNYNPLEEEEEPGV